MEQSSLRKGHCIIAPTKTARDECYKIVFAKFGKLC